MNQKIKNHLIEYCKKRGYRVEDRVEDSDLIELITGIDPIFREEIDRRRWWVEYFYVVEIDGMLIRYANAESDDGEDRGYEFDLNSIEEVKAVEKTVIVTEYVPID